MIVLVGSIIVALYRLVHAQHVEEWAELAKAGFLAICVAVLAVLSLRLANCFALKWVRHSQFRHDALLVGTSRVKFRLPARWCEHLRVAADKANHHHTYSGPTPA